MKVCPQCQASFEEGYVYCPHDETQLVAYDLRGVLRRRRQQEFRGELNLLLPSLSFGQRLARELAFTGSELRRHPVLFVRELLRGEGSTRQRVYLLQSGAAAAVMAYSLIITALIGWGVAYGLPSVKAELPPKPPTHFSEPLVYQVMPVTKSEIARNSKGHLGGSMPQPQRAHGGGTGGNESQLQASKGVTPPAAIQEQIVLPNPLPPMIENAKLTVPTHVVVDPESVRRMIGRIGLTESLIAPPSQGTGTGGGMGEGDGTGVGKHGKGKGIGDGDEWNTGGGKPRKGGDDFTGSGDGEPIPMATGSMRPTILYREKARYTEEARQQKIQGAVILLATFTADGRITNVRVLKGLPEGLTQEAIKAAQRIRFNPATRNGVAVTVQARLEYNFSLY